MFDSAKNADTAIKYVIAVLTFELLKKLNLSAAIFIAQSKIITINKQEIINTNLYKDAFVICFSSKI